MIRIEAGSSIPYLVWSWDYSLSVKSNISEAGLYNIIPNISFTAISARCFIFFLFQPMGVSFKEREFTYSNFQQLINSTTHQILCLGGSSIP
jgi:hypothetical protein